jgi:hypothetical protein
MKRSLFGILVVAVGAVAACNPFAPDQSVILNVTQLDAPAMITAASPLTVVLTVTVGGCVTFERIAVVRGVSGASMIAWGRDGAKGKNVACPQDIRFEPHSYQFDPPFPSQSAFTIQVQRGRLGPLNTTVQVQ